jgi:phage terminase large subunit
VPTIKAIRPYRPMVDAEARYVLAYGGRGSGKSVAASQALLELSFRRTGRAIAVRKVGRTLRLSVFPRLRSELSAFGQLDRTVVNKSEMSFLLSNGSEIDCLGLDDPEKVKSLEKPWLAWIEEADSLTEDDFNAVDFILRQGGDKIIMTFNPPPMVPGVPHWIKDRFIDRQDPNAVVIKTTWRDNPFIPKTYTERLERLKDENPHLYKMWALGEFVGLVGSIFTNWGIVNEIPAEAKFLGYGLDFGFSIDPAVVVACYRYDGEYYHREIVYETGLTNHDLARAMRAAGVQSGEEIIADSAEPKSIEELRRAGFNIRPAIKGQDSVRAGLDYMLRFRHNIERNSTGLIREFGSYCWKTDTAGNPKPQPVDEMNHGIDAIRYRLFAKQATPLEFVL